MTRPFAVTTLAVAVALSSAPGITAQAQAQHAALLQARLVSESRAIAVKDLSEFPDAPGTDLSRSVDAGQNTGTAETSGSITLKGLPGRILRDEAAIVTSPARLRTDDLRWLLPLAAASTVSLAMDSKTMRDVVSHNAAFNDAALTSSDVLRGVFIGGPIALYGTGLLVKDEHAREAGLMAGESMIDAYVAGVAIKYATLRQRPYIDNASGSFFSGKARSDPSFVSGHSVVAWSSAAVLAGEYSRPWQQAGIYTLATGVSLSRVLGQQHFPTDVLLGSAVGWLVGHYVYRAHHHHNGRS